MYKFSSAIFFQNNSGPSPILRQSKLQCYEWIIARNREFLQNVWLHKKVKI
jgi:hypothetical protein